jgi:hypothetical protein
MQVPVDQQPRADDMEVNRVLGEIDADVLFVPAKRASWGSKASMAKQLTMHSASKVVPVRGPAPTT